MIGDRKKQLLRVIQSEAKKIEKIAREAKEAADQRMTGWSQAGDKYHAQSSSSLTKAYLENLKKLEREIRGAEEKELKKVACPCYVEIKYSGAPKLSFFLVKNAVSLANVLFISNDSPLARALKGKGEGDSFSYRFGSKSGKLFKGKILLVD